MPGHAEFQALPSERGASFEGRVSAVEAVAYMGHRMMQTTSALPVLFPPCLELPQQLSAEVLSFSRGRNNTLLQAALAEGSRADARIGGYLLLNGFNFNFYSLLLRMCM